MVQTGKKKLSTPLLISLVFFTLFYPMLISIYVFLPLFIGALSYILILGLQNKNPLFLALPIIYLINLEINLSLPLFLSIITTFFFFVTLYPSLLYFRRCKLCKPLISVLILDFLYLGALLSFDFIFDLKSVTLDESLLYSLIIDLLVVTLI